MTTQYPVKLLHVVIGCFLGVMFLVIPLALLQVSSDTVSPVAAAPNPFSQASPGYIHQRPSPAEDHPGKAVEDPRYEILLKSRQFTPQPGIEEALTTLLSTFPAPQMHVMIQFDHIPDEKERQILATAGVHLLTYIPYKTWFASIPADLNLTWAEGHFQAEALASVRWMGRILPADRLSPHIRAGNFGPWSQRSDGTISLIVQGHADVSLEEIAALIEKFGGKMISQVSSMHAVVAVVPREQIEALAGQDIIQWIEETAPPFMALNDGSRPLINVDDLQAAPYNLDGTGVRVLVYDAGLVDTTHGDLAGRVITGEVGTTIDHATHVAGTIGGDGTLSVPPTTTVNLRGMAPNANLVSFAWNSAHLVNNPGDIQANYTSAIVNHSVHIANNSISSNVGLNYSGNCAWEGDYNTMAGQIDGIVRGSLNNTKLPVVWANGNERVYACGTAYNTTPPPATAKNVIAVGAVNTNDRSMTNFSSWGPVDDGRLRPDVVAGGCQNGGDGGIRSTIPNIFTNTSLRNCDGSGDDFCYPYDTMCGTSMATPAVTGASSLLLQRHRAICAGESDPWPSTVKALLIHTARDLGNAGPDYQFGYGLVDARAAVDMIPYYRQDQISHGATNALAVTIGAMDRLTVTLVWDDPAAAANANPALVNDLGLELVDPSLNVHHPFRLNPVSPTITATIGVNTRDNVEQVVVDNPASGLWLIRVQGTSVPTGPQTYSLVSEALSPSDTTCTPPEPTDVWIRDNAGDTGSEPSSGTLYLSPDVWVRHASDGGTAHQNPEFGQTNYIYAKVRNRGSVTANTVNAYIYWGNASTGLAWPNTMHLIGIATVTNLAAGGDVTIAPLPWNPPGTGHYCLYVRLVSLQDPIAPPPEVSSLSTNTSQHNNIAWKNLNIVDNQPNTSTSVSFIIRNVVTETEAVNLYFYPEFEYLERSRIIFDLGEKLYARCLEQGGCKTIGLEPLGEGRYQIFGTERSGIEGIPLEFMEEAEVGLEFTAPPGDAPRTYTMDVTQEGEAGVEGGIQYQLRTPGTPVISEVYYFTTREPDDNQFIELYNPYEEAIYLDGLIIVHDDNVYQFPGRLGGREYGLWPHSFTVIANDAVDDGEDVELKGATWEIYGSGDDEDNPDVPNVTLVKGSDPDLNLNFEVDGIFIASGTDVEPPIDGDTVIDGVNWGQVEVLADTNTSDANPHPGADDGFSLQRRDPEVDQNDSAKDFAVVEPTLAADMGISVGGPRKAAPGSTIFYTLVYTSYEVLPATDVVVSLDLPEGVSYVSFESDPPVNVIDTGDPVRWDIGTVRPRESGVIQLLAQISGGVSTGTRLAATAAVEMDPALIEGDPMNNTDQTETAVAVAEIGVNKYILRDLFEDGIFSKPVAPGERYTYTINYGNEGDLASTDVQITDALPADVTFVGFDSTAPVTLVSTEPLVWAVGTMPPGASETISVVVEVDAGVAEGAVLLNSVEITGDWDQEAGNNSSRTWTQVRACYDLTGDNTVDLNDIQAVAEHWRARSTDPNWSDVQQYDLDGDEVITVRDIVIVATHWGESCDTEFDIAGTVYTEEAGGNCDADAGELRFAGVTVQLIDPGPDGAAGGGDDALVDEAITDGNGDFRFEDLTEGDYYLFVPNLGGAPLTQVFTVDALYDGTLTDGAGNPEQPNFVTDAGGTLGVWAEPGCGSVNGPGG